ncbi:transcriptional regulator family: Fungal Specific TF [Trichoderma harzianum]|nr:transcriptional regulator family: Fungal Specific TF [Trichoderma harzianum]
MPQDNPKQKRTKSEYDLMLVKRRRFRPAKACYPCRRRKVKCNLGQPCESCNIRGHPDLCDYTTPIQANASDKASNASEAGKSHLASDHEDAVATPAEDISIGLYVDPVAPYDTKLHLGPDSLPSLLAKYESLSSNQQNQERNCWQGAAFKPPTNPQTIFELLCLQDSSTVSPFTNLWKPEDGPEVVYNALPEDEALRGYVRFFQYSLLRILPFTINFPQFEAALSEFLHQRSEHPAEALQTPPSACTLTWFGLLFSILACGAQLGSDQESELIKARVFGLTIRLAQTLGLHWSPDPDTVDVDQRDEATMTYYIWRSLIWQDTLVSLCYGRPSCIIVMDEIPSESSSSALTPPQTYSFTTSCNHLFIIANKICQALNKAGFTRKPLSASEIQDFKKIIDRIAKQSTPHLQDVEKCRNRDECIQHNFFREFVDSVMLCLYRPALLSNGDAYNKELWAPYLQHCRSVLHTFLELLKLDCPIRRSWVFVHVTLSCALTLGIAANAQNDISDKLFLKGFLDTFSKANIFANVSSYQEALRLLRQSMSTYD